MASTSTALRGRLLGVSALFAASLLTSAALGQDSRPKIAFLLKTMQEERYATDKQEFIAAAEKLGVQVSFDAAGNDEERQIQEFDAALEEGAKVVVLQPVNTGTAGALVAKANARGVRVVGYDSMITNGPLDAMVMQDSWKVGQLQAQALEDWLKARNGKVAGSLVLVMGQPGDSNAQALSSGILDMVARNPGIELVASRSHVDWSPDAARETAESLLLKRHNRIDAFICNNSGLAFGVLQALREQGLADTAKVFVAGADADLRNIRLVARGQQSLEIWKPIRPLAQKAAEVAVALAREPGKPVTGLVSGFVLKNNGRTDVPTFVTPVIAVGKDMIESTVIAQGLYTRNQIDGDE